MFLAALSWYKKLSGLRSRSFANALQIYFKPGNTVLDFGCGNMYTAKELSLLVSDLSITGIDVVRDQNLDHNVLDSFGFKFVLLENKALPFEENSFDVVLALATMHHTFSPEYYLSELKRVCKPSGKIILVEEMYINWLDKIYISAQDYLLNKMKKGVPVPLQFRSKKHYLQQFINQELTIENATFVRPKPTCMHHYVFILKKMFNP